MPFTRKTAFFATILSSTSIRALEAWNIHRGFGCGAGGEPAALDAVGVGVDPLDPPPLDEDPRRHVADRVLEEAAAGVVHLDAVAGEALLAADEDDVALGQSRCFTVPSDSSSR